MAEALLRCKIDMQSENEVMLLRLTTYSDEVDKVLFKSPALAACRAALLDAGCDLIPPWGNGAKVSLGEGSEGAMGDLNRNPPRPLASRRVDPC